MIQTVPTYQIDAAEVQQAFDAYAALQRQAKVEPSLADNEYFKALLDAAYSRFLLTFEAL